MREILFKAKRLDNGEWVDGYYFKSFDAYSEKEQHRIIETHCYFFGQYEGFSEPYEIDPDTLCQFTGLTDKNGNKIWENDIVGHIGDKEEIIFPEIVEYGSWDYNTYGFSVCCVTNDVKVIGNKFDNSGLLKGDN